MGSYSSYLHPSQPPTSNVVHTSVPLCDSWLVQRILWIRTSTTETLMDDARSFTKFTESCIPYSGWMSDATIPFLFASLVTPCVSNAVSLSQTESQSQKTPQSPDPLDLHCCALYSAADWPCMDHWPITRYPPTPGTVQGVWLVWVWFNQSRRQGNYAIWNVWLFAVSQVLTRTQTPASRVCEEFRISTLSYGVIIWFVLLLPLRWHARFRRHD